MGDREEHYNIPEQSSTLKKLVRVMKRSGQWNALVTEDGKSVRVKVEDTGSQVIRQKRRTRLVVQRQHARRQFMESDGDGTFGDVNNASLASDMVGGRGWP